MKTLNFNTLELNGNFGIVLGILKLKVDKALEDAKNGQGNLNTINSLLNTLTNDMSIISIFT